MRRLYWGVKLLLPLLLVAGCTSVGNREAAEAYYNLGNAYFELGKLDESQRAYRRALELDASLAAANYNLARLYIEEKRFDEAEEILLALTEKDRNNSILYETLGWLSYRRGEYDAAVSWYRRALDLGEGNASAWYNIGQIYTELGRHTDAVEAFRQAIYYAPDTLAYRLGLAEVYTAAEEYRETVDLLYPVYSAGERDSRLLLLLLKNLVASEEYPAALEVSDAALDELKGADPQDSGVERGEVLFYKAFTLLVGFEDTDAGLAALQEALDAGFNSLPELAKLLEYPDIPGFDEVKRLLDEKNLAPQDASGAGNPVEPN